MTTQQIERPRIFDHITRTRFLHVEDALEIGKIRFFIGAYERGSGAQETAYHFLDLADARPLFADLGWGKKVEFTDYKGTANGGQPLSRVLKIKGPKDGKYWLEIQNGPGQVIGQGAVKPAGEPDASISIALTPWEMRRLALAITEYLLAYRVVLIIEGPAQSLIPNTQSLIPDPQSLIPTPPSPPSSLTRPDVRATVERYTDPAQDRQDLFGPDPVIEDEPAEDVVTEEQPKAQPTEEEAIEDDTPAAFYQLAPAAIRAGMLDLVNALVQAPGPWSEKTAQLKEALTT